MTPSKKKNKGGRPPSGRTEHMQLRLSEEEKQAFSEAAAKYGLSLSDWTRQILRGASMPQPDASGLPAFNMRGKAGD